MEESWVFGILWDSLDSLNGMYIGDFVANNYGVEWWFDMGFPDV